MANDLELHFYLQDSLRILQHSLVLARQGTPPFYRVVALQLRILLCDTTRQHNRIANISLVTRLVPGFALHQLLPDGRSDINALVLPLAEWLELPLPFRLTIRQFIRRVCDMDGGAPVDPRPQAGLPPQPERIRWVILLGSLVANELTSMNLGIYFEQVV